MKIKDLNPDEKPIERLIQHGAQCLSSTELLAIIIRTGYMEVNAVDMARQLLANAGGSLTTLSSMSYDNVCSIRGLGPGKAAGVIAALEIGKRLFSEGTLSDSGIIQSAEQAFLFLYPKFKGIDHEESWVVWLDRDYKLLGADLMSLGGFSSTTIDYRCILKKAIEKNAKRLIIAHNHPSGDPHPSVGDIQETSILSEQCSAIGIALADHIIISERLYYSFQEEKVFSTRKLLRNL